MDYGTKRTGLARGDELGLATPLPPVVLPAGEARWQALGEAVRRERPSALVVGYPLNMDGTAGPRAREVDAFIAELERRFGLPVERVDERLTSADAAEQLAAGGRRKHRLERFPGELDSRAAALLLQDFLDTRFPAPPLPLPGDEERPTERWT